MQLRIRPVVAVFVLAAFAVLVVAVSTAVLLWKLRAKDLVHAHGETVSLSHVLADQTTRSIQNIDLAVQNTQVLLAELDAKRVPLSGRVVHELLRNRLVDMPQIRGIFITDAQGKVLNTARVFPVNSLEVGDREYFTAHRDDSQLGLFIGSPTNNRINGAWTLYLSRKLLGSKGEFRGVIAVALNIPYFEDLYKSITFDGIAPISLYLADGTLVARAPREESAVGEHSAAVQARDFSEDRDAKTVDEKTTSDNPRIVTYHQVHQFPLLVSVAIGETEALTVWREKSRLIIASAVGIILIIMVAAWALAREMSREESLSTELWESGQRLQATVNSAMDAIVIADASQRVVLFNRAAEAMFGYRAAEAVGSPLDRFMPARYAAAHRHHVEQFGASEIDSRDMSRRGEITGLRADGKEFPIEATVSQVRLSGEILYTAILRDVTERRQAERQLHESNRQLRELSGSLQTVREEERTRISRELHDELGQQLTGLKMDLSWLGKHLDDEPPAPVDKVESMKRQVDATIKSVRRLSTELRPPVLDDLGLGPAIEWLASDFTRKTGVGVKLNLSGGDAATGEAVVTSLFRIVQECLTNVARHAGATQVDISLLLADAALELKVTDNGRGMTSAPNGERGNGLVGIRERAFMLGATAVVSSWPGKGTEVKVAIPLNALAEATKEA